MENPETQVKATIFVTPVLVKQKEVIPPKEAIPKGYFRRWTPQGGFKLIPIPKGENWWGE